MTEGVGAGILFFYRSRPVFAFLFLSVPQQISWLLRATYALKDLI